MDQIVEQKQSGWRGSAELWLDAAYGALVSAGVDAVKVMPLAQHLGLSRTSFYHHFDSREALLAALIRRWEDINTGNLIARTEQFAASITEAVFNLFDCWLDNDLFDSRLDLAIRNWARNDPALQGRLARADHRRKEAMQAVFLRFGYDPAEAEVRALTMIYTQIGYISMQVSENREQRLARMPDYIEVFTGRKPTEADTQRFMARHLSVAI